MNPCKECIVKVMCQKICNDFHLYLQGQSYMTSRHVYNAIAKYPITFYASNWWWVIKDGAYD